MSYTSSMLDWALYYASLGIPVFPLVPYGKTPLTPNGFKDASTDIERIKQWWNSYPNANIGIPTGRASGFWVLDIDSAEGEIWLKLNVVLPNAAVQRTAKGRHIIFAYCEGMEIRNSVKKIAGIDVRAEGGYIVAAPSIHPSGAIYTWETPLSNNLHLAPKQLLQALKPKTARKPSHIVPMLRNHDSGSQYGLASLNYSCAAIIAAESGEQNTTLNGNAYSIGKLVAGGHLNPSYALHCLVYAGMHMAPDGKPWTYDHVLKIVLCALKAGVIAPNKT